MINLFGRVHILAEVFGLAMAPQYLKNANILAYFIQENEAIDLFSGQVQYYLEHTIRILSKLKTYRLAFVRWFKPVPSSKSVFILVLIKLNKALILSFSKMNFMI